MSWRGSLALFLDRVGVLEGVLQIRRRVRLPLLTALTYHRVSEVTSHEFDQDVIDATLREFEAQIAILTHSFVTIGIDELRAYFYKRKKLPPNAVLITFDDGYRDCHDQALPILKRYGARAVFFIATHYLTERRLFWWDRISYVVKKSARERIHITYPNPADFDLSHHRTQAINVLLRIVKDHYDLDLNRFLDELTSACGMAWSAELEETLANDLLMTWDQVRALQRAGMDVQSHTHTHRILQTLPPEQIHAELNLSRQELEKQLDHPVRAIAYPVGRALNRDPNLGKALRETGYEIGFSNATGLNVLQTTTDPLDLRRIAVDTGVSPSYFRASITFPMFAHSKPAAKLIRW